MPRLKTSAAAKKLLAHLPKAKPEFIQPMRPELVTKLPTGQDWQYELKWDGYRAVAVKHGADVKLFSRNHKSLTADFRTIIHQLSQLPISQLVLDGELVAFDKQGRPSFQLMQNSSRSNRSVAFIAFDLLNLDGHSTLALPLTDRHKLLKRALRSTGIQISEPLNADADRVLAVIRKLNLEGVVAKKRSSKYSSGLRGGSWFKLRLGLAQEFVVGGYSRGEPFNSLLVGYYSGRKFIYAGKVKAGFIQRIRRALMDMMKPLKIEKCPFIDLPQSRSSRWGEGLTAEEMAKCTWVKPKLVVQVSFVEWTEHGHLRHARFLGLRKDKRPTAVKRES